VVDDNRVYRDRSSAPEVPRRARRRRIVLRYLTAALFGIVLLLILTRRERAGCGTRLPPIAAIAPGRWLAAAIADVPCAGRRVGFDVHDNLGAQVDALDPIDDPAGAPAGPGPGRGYLGVYHSPIGSGRHASFMVSLARSSDLIHWTRVRVLIARGASMPTLRPVPGTAGFVLAYERSGGLNEGDTIALRWYPSEAALLAGRPGSSVDLPLVLSKYNDGTPALTAIAWRGGPRHSVIGLGFHYESATPSGGPGVDREAIGVVYGFRRLVAAPDRATDAALNARGLAGSHGDRRQFSFAGTAWQVYEAQAVRPSPPAPASSASPAAAASSAAAASFGTWHVLVRPAGGGSPFVSISIGLPGGPFAASFGNPIVSVLHAPRGHGTVLAVTMFVFGSGPAAAHAGELVYYQPL
jgi:hypothetical protein